MKGAKNFDFYNEVIQHYKKNLEENEIRISNFPSKNEWDTSPYRSSDEILFIGLELSKFTLKLLIIIASYSRGDDKTELRKQFSEAVFIMKKVWNKKAVKMFLGAKQKEHDAYYIGESFSMRWMFSLAILLEVPDDEFFVLLNFIKRDNIKDAMYDICIKFRIKDWTISEVVRPLSPKNKVIDIIKENDKGVCEKLIKQYLEKHWFKTFKNWGWISTDVSNFDVNSGFVGYWAFEVAAIVKIKGLDDSSFRENVFYPDRLL